MGTEILRKVQVRASRLEVPASGDGELNGWFAFTCVLSSGIHFQPAGRSLLMAEAPEAARPSSTDVPLVASSLDAG